MDFLAEIADFALLTSYRERKVNAAISSSAVAQVCVLDAVFFAAARCQSKKAEELSERIEKTADRLLRSGKARRNNESASSVSAPALDDGAGRDTRGRKRG